MLDQAHANDVPKKNKEKISISHWSSTIGTQAQEKMEEGPKPLGGLVGLVATYGEGA